MFSNYLKIAWRQINRSKLYSAINVFGLAIGMSVCLLLLIFIFHELQYDTFHENRDRIYRLLTKRSDEFKVELSRTMSAPVGPALKARFPGIESFNRMQITSSLARIDDRLDKIRNILFVDTSFFSMFTFDIVSGDPHTALSDPHSLILSESTAERLFGDENPIGRQITLQNRATMIVTAIVEDCPTNSHFGYRAIAPFPALAEVWNSPDLLTNESNWNYSTYLMLTPGTTPEMIEAGLPEYLEEEIEEGITDKYAMLLQPLEDIHLTTGISFEVASVVDSKYLYGLSILALFIIVIACVNFMNLSTARSIRRAKEVGLRKVMGADKKRLVRQFLGESILLAVIAIPLSLVLVELFLPTFSNLVYRNLELISDPTMPVLLLIPLLALLVGIGGGVYPAFILSRYKPAAILRGNFATGRQGMGLRRGLIIFQFVLSIMLLISTFVVHRQVEYMVSRDPGYDKEQIIYVGNSAQIRENYDAFRNDLMQMPGVLAVARGGSIPCQVHTRQSYIAGGGGQDTVEMPMYSLIVDYDYVDAVGLEIIDGRNFDPAHGTDEAEGYIINETTARLLGWQDDPIGKPLRVWSEGEGKVIGVVRDFNHKSLRRDIEPLVLRMEPGWLNTIVMRLTPENFENTLAAIKDKWSTYSPDFPFSETHLDVAVSWQYLAERRLEKIFIYASILAIIVACLGLYGIAHYSTVVRTREVGVRKVLGASVRSVTLLFIREFVIYVIIANLIAWPIAYLAMQAWLEDFAYRTSVGVSTLFLSGLVVLAVAVGTVAFRAWRAANTNPSTALRYE